MKLSIIIPTYNRLQILKTTYDAVLDAVVGLSAEVIVINDDKRSNAGQVAEGIGINPAITRVADNPKQGAASARNLGASLASGDLLLFIDDDIIVNKRTLVAITELHTDFDKILSTPIWEYSDEMIGLLKKSPFGRYRLKYDYTSIRGETGNELEGKDKIFLVNSLASFCLSIKRTHYQQLGGMDESFPYAGCEDQDFAEKARLSGFKLLLDENNMVLHHELDRLERKNWMQRQFKGVQGYVLLAQKYPKRKEVQLWFENTPFASHDTTSLKIKKGLKCILRQEIVLGCLNLFVRLCERVSLPDAVLMQLYNIQSGIYINKGFTKSYKENACNSHNG